MLPLGLGLGAFPRSCTYCNAMACHIYPVLLRPTCLRYRHFPLRTSLLNFGITVSLCASPHIFAAAFRSERQWLRETAFMSLLLMPHVVAMVTQVIYPDVDCAVLLSKYSARLVKYGYGCDKADNIEVLSYARCVVDPALYIITRLWLEGYGLGGTKDFCECA